MLEDRTFSLYQQMERSVDYTPGVVLVAAALLAIGFLILSSVRAARSRGVALGPGAGEGLALALAAAICAALAVTLPGIAATRALGAACGVGVSVLALFRMKLRRSDKPDRAPGRAAALVLAVGAAAVGIATAGSSAVAFRSTVVGEAPSVFALTRVIESSQHMARMTGESYLSLDGLGKRYPTRPPLPVPGGRGHEHYLFTDMATKDGHALDRRKEYALCAVPRKYMVTGQHTVIMDQTGGRYYKDTRGMQVMDFPVDPEAAGWKKMAPPGRDAR